MSDGGELFFDDGQGALPFADLPGAELVTQEEAKGRYTGERLRSQRPKVYAECIRMLAGGAAVRAIQRTLGLHHSTVAAVASADPAAIAALRRQAASLARIGASLTVETIIEAVGDARERGELSIADAQRMAVIFGILTDKAELLSGGVTQRIEHRREDHADAAEVIYDLPDETVEGETLDPTGLPAGAAGQKDGAEVAEVADLEADGAGREEDK